MNVSRRRFLSLGVGAFVVLTLPASLRRMTRQARRSVPVMGTIADLVVVDSDAAKAQEAIDAAIHELRWVERTMSHFTADSDVGRANLSAGTGPVVVTAATATVLEEALRWAEASDGRFDPCLGRATALWDVRERLIPPSTSETGRFAGEGLYRELEVDEASTWSGSEAMRRRSTSAASPKATRWTGRSGRCASEASRTPSRTPAETCTPSAAPRTVIRGR
jgi:thiamine biosynthesis lipoprotein